MKKNILKILAMLGLPILALAQTQTPSTTLCAAVTVQQSQVCLNSTTNIVNQTGLYIDGELMLVQLSNNATVAAGPAYVPVARAQRAGTVPAIHSNGAVVWEALTPSLTVVPGSNGFFYSTQYTDVGPCVRGNEAYLPHIWPDRGFMRDCPVANGSTTGVWSDYNPTGNTIPGANTFQVLTTNGAILPTGGNYVITKAGVLADTLAAPTSTVQDGTIIRVVSATANAHTITATGLLQTGTSSVNVATFAAQAGAGVTLMAYQGKWIVLYSVGITFS